MIIFLVRSLNPSTEKYKPFERAFSDKIQAEEYAAFMATTVFQPTIEEIQYEIDEFFPAVYWWFVKVCRRSGYVSQKIKLSVAVLHRDRGYSPKEDTAFAFGSTYEEALAAAQEELNKGVKDG